MYSSMWIVRRPNTEVPVQRSETIGRHYNYRAKAMEHSLHFDSHNFETTASSKAKTSDSDADSAEAATHLILAIWGRCAASRRCIWLCEQYHAV
jgi:hypothetical protein